MKPGMEKVKRKVSSILKSKLKINNVEIERAHRLTRKKSHNKDKPRVIVFKLHSYENKESIMWHVYHLKDTGYIINEGSSKATLNISAELWDKVKRLRGESYFAVIKYDRIITNKRYEVARE